MMALPTRKSLAPAGMGTMSWQTLLADLALILFLVTAAGIGDTAPIKSAPANAQPPTAQPANAPAALAIWRAGPGAPPLAAWLAAQSPDPRERLTITARYTGGGVEAATAQASALTAQAGPMAQTARIAITPAAPGAPVTELTATLGFDGDDASADKGVAPHLAQGLR